MWDLEFDEFSRLWEFWNNAGMGLNDGVFVSGAPIASFPGGDASSAMWFPRTGHMYAVGNKPGDVTPHLSRSDGATWSGSLLVPSLSIALDHVVAIPRGAGELWVTGHEPFQVYQSLDGVTWTEVEVPAHYPTDSDGNHLTALGVYRGRVWVATQDSAAQVTRVLREPLTPGSQLQII